MRVLFWLFVLLVAIVLALFAVANREIVSLGIWPLPFLLQLPLYVAVLVPVLLSFAAGALAGWIGGRRWRGETRRSRRRVATLERELSATQARLPQPEAPASSGALVRHGAD